MTTATNLDISEFLQRNVVFNAAMRGDNVGRHDLHVAARLPGGSPLPRADAVAEIIRTISRDDMERLWKAYKPEYRRQDRIGRQWLLSHPGLRLSETDQNA